MRNPRMMGLPPFVLGVTMFASSVGTLLQTPSSWADPSWLLSIPGTVFGLAATLVGAIIVLGVSDFVFTRTEA
jgi:hypothetical protein